MMKSTILATLIASAAAFAPAAKQQTSTSLKAFENELGAQPPLGFYDPFDFVTGKSQEEFDRLRGVEIKHGRISMLAVVGYLTTAAGVRFQGAEEYDAGFKAVKQLFESDEGKNVFAQTIGFIAVAEMCNRRGVDGTPGEFPGDFRNGAIDFGWDKQSEEWKLRKRAIELNNGRAAMMGILGLMVHEQIHVSILPGGVLPGN